MSVIIHVPHAGDGMPDELMESVTVSRGEFDHLHEKMKDDGVSRVLSYGIDNPVKSDYAMQWEELRMLKAGHSVPNAHIIDIIYACSA